MGVIRFAILLLGLTLTAYAQLGVRNPFFNAALLKAAAAGGGGGGDSCSTCTNETFEGAGYVLTGWTEAGVTANEDYATAPAPLSGSQSMLLRNSSGGFDTVYTEKTGDSATESWFRFMFVVTNAAPTGLYISAIADSGGTAQSVVSIQAGKLRVSCGTATADTVSTITAGTTYYAWHHYKKGTGANGVADIGFSTTKTRPTSGNGFAQTTTGTATANSFTFRLGGGDGAFVGAYGGIIFDDASFTSIGVIGDFP